MQKAISGKLGGFEVIPSKTNWGFEKEIILHLQKENQILFAFLILIRNYVLILCNS